MAKKKMPTPPSLGRNLLTYGLIFLALVGLLQVLNAGGKKQELADMSAVASAVKSGQVERIEIDGTKLTVKQRSGDTLVSQREPSQPLSQLLRDYGVTPEELAAVAVNVHQPSAFQTWMGFVLPFLLPLMVLGVLVWMMIRQMQGASSRAMGFGQTTARAALPDQRRQKVTFADVAGAHEAKEELVEVVQFLRTPEKFKALGAKVPRGVLLVGAPGTGKTLLARAVAGEAGVPFFHLSGSEFVEMFVGVGASRVRDLFRQAKKHSPCIIFIDEIDAVGRQRGTGMGGSHDEREQTLNQILVEMDGFESDVNVIVVAATNRPDVLDPALLRPGRFDRQASIDLPDVAERQLILAVHAKGKPLAPDVDLAKLAKRTPGFSGADLANVLNEAAIMAARRNEKQIGEVDVEEASEKVKMGPQRKSFLLNDAEKKTVAYHEAGHALVAHRVSAADPVHKVSIISRGRAAGYTSQMPEERKLRSRSHLEADLAVFMGGYEAELLVNGEVTTGASNDLQRATGLARDIVMHYGMSEQLGTRTFGEQGDAVFLGREIHAARDFSEKTAEAIDSEVSKLLATAQATARKIITDGRQTLDSIVARLLEVETLEADEFAKLADA